MATLFDRVCVEGGVFTTLATLVLGISHWNQSQGYLANVVLSAIAFALAATAVFKSLKKSAKVAVTI